MEWACIHTQNNHLAPKKKEREDRKMLLITACIPVFFDAQAYCVLYPKLFNLTQMCGRAGRPPFNDTGTVIIMTRRDTVTNRSLSPTFSMTFFHVSFLSFVHSRLFISDFSFFDFTHDPRFICMRIS